MKGCASFVGWARPVVYLGCPSIPVFVCVLIVHSEVVLAQFFFLLSLPNFVCPPPNTPFPFDLIQHFRLILPWTSSSSAALGLSLNRVQFTWPGGQGEPAFAASFSRAGLAGHRNPSSRFGWAVLRMMVSPAGGWRRRSKIVRPLLRWRRLSNRLFRRLQVLVDHPHHQRIGNQFRLNLTANKQSDGECGWVAPVCSNPRPVSVTRVQISKANRPAGCLKCQQKQW